MWRKSKLIDLTWNYSIVTDADSGHGFRHSRCHPRDDPILYEQSQCDHPLHSGIYVFLLHKSPNPKRVGQLLNLDRKSLIGREGLLPWRCHLRRYRPDKLLEWKTPINVGNVRGWRINHSMVLMFHLHKKAQLSRESCCGTRRHCQMRTLVNSPWWTKGKKGVTWRIAIWVMAWECLQELCSPSPGQ